MLLYDYNIIVIYIMSFKTKSKTLKKIDLGPYTVSVQVEDLKQTEKTIISLNKQIKKYKENESNNNQKISNLQNENNTLKQNNQILINRDEILNEKYSKLLKNHNKLKEKHNNSLSCIEGMYNSSLKSLDEISELKIKAYEL